MIRIFKVLVLLLLINYQTVYAEDKAYTAYEKGEKLYQEKKYNEALT